MLWKNGRRSEHIEDRWASGAGRRGGLVSDGIGTIVQALYVRVDPGMVLDQVAQRARWFQTGFVSGKPQMCDTVNALSF